LPLAIISAYEPFFGGLSGSLDGGGVGCPFLNEDVAEFWIAGPRLVDMVVGLEEFVVKGLVSLLIGLDVWAICALIFSGLSTSLRGLSSARCLEEKVVGDGVGSPEI
jgi:hypothetical protein